MMYRVKEMLELGSKRERRNAEIKNQNTRRVASHTNWTVGPPFMREC